VTIPRKIKRNIAIEQIGCDIKRGSLFCMGTTPMLNPIFSFFKLLIRNLNVNEDQIWRCLSLTTPLYASITIYIFSLIFMFYPNIIRFELPDFNFIFQFGLFIGFLLLIYYIFVFFPAIFVQLKLHRYHRINFFTVILSALFLTYVIPTLLMLIFAPLEQFEFFVIEFFYVLGPFSLTYAVIYWILLLRADLKQHLKNGT